MNAENTVNLTENLSSKLNDIVNWLDVAAKTTGEFVSTQTPLFIQEYLTYNFWVSLVWWCIALVFFILSIGGGLFVAWRAFKKEYDDLEFVITMVSLVTFSISGIVMLENSDWIKIKLAPRVYIVENIKKILK